TWAPKIQCFVAPLPPPPTLSRNGLTQVAISEDPSDTEAGLPPNLLKSIQSYDRDGVAAWFEAGYPGNVAD
ncbi:unnamed protein product, partial [Chrysoparadoxa australica]